LRDKGVTVHLFGQLLAQALDQPGAREFLQDQLTTATRFGPALDKPLDELVASASAERLSEALIGGVLRRDLDLADSSSLLLSTSSRTTSYCAHCRTTCSSATTRRGVRRAVGNPMSKLPASARRSTRRSLELPSDVSQCRPQCTSITETTPESMTRPTVKAGTSGDR
jgi:hypothetical protein